jgi:dihydrofolate reductase
MLTIVVAMNKERVIGVDNQLPWHIPEDLQHFKQVTLGKPIIMGRKTFESIGRVLPGRKNIVITRNLKWSYPGVEVYTSLESALLANSEDAELCIIGGGEIFKKALPIADKLHLTILDIKVDNPTVFFPEIDYTKWCLISSKEIMVKDNISCVFNEYTHSL